MHDLPLITTLAVAFSMAWVFGLLTQRIGLSPIVGYLIAGVMIGPHTPGFSGDLEIAQQLAEVGVMLLMFGVGLHFHVKDLIAVKGIAIPGALGQSLVATVLGMVIFVGFGIPATSAAVIGMAMAVASTVVLMRVLIEADALHSIQGHVAVGWLLVEDLITVLVLVLIPVLADARTSGDVAGWGLAIALGWAIVKLAAVAALIVVAGSRIIPWVLVQVARLRSRELFTLTVLVFSIAVAAGVYELFGASMALGAFLAGMVVAQSPASHQAAADALPMRDAFAVLFFVSVGMLFDPTFILREPLMILAALGIILIAKPLVALIIVVVLGHSGRTALTAAVGLAQIGEFSFILSELARREGIMPDEGHSVLVSAAIISITINPLVFRQLPAIEKFLRDRPRWWQLLNGRAERKSREQNRAIELEIHELASDATKLAIVVGFGPVGRSVDRLLREADMTTVVIDMNLDTVSELTAQGARAVFGDASQDSILEQAGMRKATHLVLTLPHSADRQAVVRAAVKLNPQARILVRARYLREREDLEQAGATAAVFEEAEAAVALARLVLADTGAGREVVERKVRDLRMQLILENMSNIRSQKVRSIMIPWNRVLRIAAADSHQTLLNQIARHRFSRWPVTEPQTGKVLGYILAKDLIAEAEDLENWNRLVRPVRMIRPDDEIATILLDIQTEGTSICIVEDSGFPVGLITLEDILEQVVGRIEDEYPHEPSLSLRKAVLAGGVLREMSALTTEDAIQELAAKIPPGALPDGCQVAELALAREGEVSTNLGNRVAVPHARCAKLAQPIVVFGRTKHGVASSSEHGLPIQLWFLLITPQEEPEIQLSLLAQITRRVSEAGVVDELVHAESDSDLLALISG